MNEIANPAGLRVLGSLIQFIENKGEIKKVLAEISAARDEANEKIRLVGKIKDIDALKRRAEGASRAAEDALSAAKAEAEDILRKAGAKATSEKEKQRKAREVLKAQEARDTELEARERSVTAREQELQAHMDRTSTLQQEASELKTRADELIAKAEEQLALFQSVASQVN